MSAATEVLADTIVGGLVRSTGAVARRSTPTGRTCGHRATYRKGCRCGGCREAERLYRAAYRARRRRLGLPPT